MLQELVSRETMHFFASLTVAIVGANTLVAVTVLAKGVRKVAHWLFFILILIFNGWIIGNYFTHFANNASQSLFANNTTYFFGVFIVPIFILFVYYFPRKSNFSWYRYILLILPAIFAAVLAFFNKYITSVQLVPGKLNVLENNQTWLIFYALIVAGYVVVYLFILGKKIRREPSMNQVKLKYVLSGFVIASAIGIFFDLLVPITQKETTIGLFGSYGTIFITVSVAYAILRYRLMDISIVIRKSAVQLLTFILLFAIYAYALLLVQRGSSSAVSLNSNTSLLITIFIIAITIEPLRKFIYKWIDGMFENKERQRQEALKRLQMVSASTTQFQSLLTRTEDELSKAIGQKPDFLMVDRQRQELVAEDGKTSLGQLDGAVLQKILTGKILIADELSYRIENGETSLQPVQAWFGKHQFAAIVPLGSGEECIGLFAFPQRGSAVFTTDVVRFLRSFQDQLQFAFANALAYKQAIERITALKQ